MKIELTIKVDYLPSWGVFEGLRELIQNGKDAVVEFEAPLDVRHRRDSNTLVIENEGAVIPHEALLFGHTSKTDRADMIGKFGEGLKLGVLALVRAGHAVRIRSGSEVWVPKIERSEKFNADVLVFYIEKGRADKKRVQIEVDGIAAEEWAEFKRCFLFLDKPKKDDVVETAYGALLMRPEDAGKLFVKGIFVQRDAEFKFGYNFHDVEVDRDRKMIARFDLEWRTRLIWSTAMSQRPDLFGQFFELVEEETNDVMGIDEYGAAKLPKEILEKAKEKFHEQFGADAVPVANIAESKDIEHLGKKGVVVNKPLKAVLQAVMGNTETVKEGLKKEVTCRHSWSALSPVEKANLEQAIFLVNGVEKLALDTIDVVDFRSDGLKGMFERDGENERVLIAKKWLTDRKETLRILVHEVAHRKGGDGDKSHVERIENIWSAIVERLRGGEAS